MSLIKVQARICPECGHDCAQLVPGVGRLVFVVACGFDGCGAVGAVGLSEAEAVFGWNTLPVVVPADLARAVA